MRKIKRITTLIAAVGIWAGVSMSASASVTFTGTATAGNGDALQATATFETLAGNLLQITLANSSTGDAHTTANLLSALFFDGASGLTPVSGIVKAGQVQWVSGVGTPLGSDLDVGKEWAYAYTGGSGSESLGSNPPHNATAGVSSSGFGWFGQGNFAPSGVALDGAPYGLVPLGFMTDITHTHDGLSNGQSDPIFENTVILTLSGWTGSDSSIRNVSFQYGTQLTDPNVVPEPTTLIAGALLLLPFGASTLRILRKRTA